MDSEIEAKFLRIDHQDMRKKLLAIGAVCQHPMRTMHRVILDFPDGTLNKQHAWARVRDEGDKVTVTYKRDSDKTFGSVHEIEITADSYEQAVKLMEALGLKILSAQDTQRETWHKDGVEVVLDIWPWLPPFIEIESSSKQAVESMAAQLGLEMEKAVFGSVTNVYRVHYPNMDKTKDIGTIPKLLFNTEPPEWFGKEGS